MKARLMYPADLDQGLQAEDIAIFAARRCRTTKSYGDLWAEISTYSDEKREQFLSNVIFQDWAADVLEMIYLIYDLEGIPIWLIIELLRHRLIAREFSIEQLSQRAISGLQLQVNAPTSELQELVDNFMQSVQRIQAVQKLAPEIVREVFPQGVLVNLVIAGNLRAFHHFWFMRASPELGGKGGAHPKFMELADQMLQQAREVLPITANTIMRA